MDIKTKTVYTIEMTPKEALWLKTLCQDAYTHDEKKSDLEIRNSFWNKLPTIPRLDAIVKNEK